MEENKNFAHSDNLNKQEKAELRRMTLGKAMDSFNPEGDEEQSHKP